MGGSSATGRIRRGERVGFGVSPQLFSIRIHRVTNRFVSMICVIRVIRGLPRRSLGGDGTASTLQRFPNSPRNLFPDFLQYISEAPEMTSHGEEPKKARTTERKLNHEEQQNENTISHAKVRVDSFDSRGSHRPRNCDAYDHPCECSGHAKPPIRCLHRR
jgi:hypothetical protein